MGRGLLVVPETVDRGLPVVPETVGRGLPVVPEAVGRGEDVERRDDDGPTVVERDAIGTAQPNTRL